MLTGAAVAYERVTRNVSAASSNTVDKTRTTNRKKNAESEQMKALLLSSVFGIVGLLIALPPFTADSQWRNAQVARSVQALEKSMKSGYFNPPNSMKYMTNNQTLEQSNLPDLAHKYALEAVKWNPEGFELWKVLYLVRNSTEAEKLLALENMKRLDPLNPDVTSVA